MIICDPSEIFQVHSAKLCDGFEANPLRSVNNLTAERLLPPHVKKDVGSMSGVTPYQKASKIVEELERQLEADSNPAEFLGKICNFLIKQTYKTLKDIGIEIMTKSGQEPDEDITCHTKRARQS